MGKTMAICSTIILGLMIIGGILSDKNNKEIELKSYYAHEVEACITKGYSWNYKADECYGIYLD